jgi:hypothetical protein
MVQHQRIGSLHGPGLCLPQIKPEHIGDACHPGSDATECAPASAARDIGGSLFNDKGVRVPL